MKVYISQRLLVFVQEHFKQHAFLSAFLATIDRCVCFARAKAARNPAQESLQVGSQIGKPKRFG
jgi:hypothetical protein